MKKKLIAALAAAAAVLVLLLAGLPLFSRLYYGRSQGATLFAWQLRKERYTTAEEFDAYLTRKREENAAPYELPEGTVLSAPPEEREYGGVPCYLLNGSAAPQRLVVYFPGGSYIDEPRAVHWQFLDALAGDAYTAVAVPLYPKLPDSDAPASYAALADFYAGLTADLAPKELVFMGDSAGGGMALSFAMQLRDAGTDGPDRLILLSPWLDVTLSSPAIPDYEARDPALDAEQLRQLGALWAGALDPADPTVSPLYGRFDGLGRITVLIGTQELLYPDALRFDEALTAAGIEHELIVYRGMFHVWPLYMAYGVPEAKEAYRDILQAVKTP